MVEFFTSTEFFLGVLWAGLATLTITLLVLMQTRWGQSRPLRKCLILSLLAHVLLAGYATTVNFVSGSRTGLGQPTIHVLIAEADAFEADSPRATPRQVRPWETATENAPVPPAPTKPQRVEPQPLPTPDRIAPRTVSDIPNPVEVSHVDVEPTPGPRAEVPRADAPPDPAESEKAAEPLEAPKAQRREAPSASVPVEALTRPADPPSIDAPDRPPGAGLPASLLEQPAPLPRMAQPEFGAETADALAGLVDQFHPASHGAPAELPLVPSEPGGGDTLPPLASGTPPSAPSSPAPAVPPGQSVPAVYQLRTAPDRGRLARARGATDETEAAVHAALRWLAKNQDADGRWNPRRHGAGRELYVAGRDRQGAGARADTGMTGLALLAFLAAGHTHEQGDYESNVRNGLTYLVSVQTPSGKLAGDAERFAAMYCHAMATIALSEAYAMTRDSRLAGPLRRAIDYTVSAQDPQGGGWRYVPGDPGDTSQFGWQLMAIKSADLAGVTTPEDTWRRMFVYLKSVSSGRYGGLAAYRAGQEASRSMTAEALVCRQWLGMPPGSPTGTEAGDYILGELPGEGKTNLYYWYYGTLGMYHLQGEYWQRWNAAMQATLLPLQHKSGSLAGSWDPNTVWGGYGGRVYSTSMATLCLEVYYRYLPVYAETAHVPGARR